MQISVGEKNRIRGLYYDRNYKDTVKELTKLYVKNKGRDFECASDEYFVLYNLALYTMKLERERDIPDYTISKYYIDRVINYFEPIKHEHEMEYYNSIWASIEMKKDELTKEDIIELYTILLDYFNRVGYKRNEVGMKINILKLLDNYEDIPLLLEEIKYDNTKEINDLIEDVLQECKSLGDTYYEMALNIISENKNYVAL